MSKPQTVKPVKEYGRPDFEAKQPAHVDAGPPDLSLVVDNLRQQNKALRDKIAKLERMIEDELRYWRRGLETGEWETREALRRRMSRLRGAVEYVGNEHWLVLHDKER